MTEGGGTKVKVWCSEAVNTAEKPFTSIWKKDTPFPSSLRIYLPYQTGKDPGNCGRDSGPVCGQDDSNAAFPSLPSRTVLGLTLVLALASSFLLLL